MPKKQRHNARFSKPQSTAPASLSISSTATAAISSSRSNRGSGSRHSQHDEQSQGRGVNELLADLRRTGLSGGAQRPVEIPPTLPPTLRNILQLPATPTLRPRNTLGRWTPRSHAGPPTPRSWLTSTASVVALRKTQQYGKPGNQEHHPLPGVARPAKGSLIDITLRRLAHNWTFQKSYCRYCLFDLPTHLRVALVTYLGTWNPGGVSVADLRAILLPFPDEETETDDQQDTAESVNPSSANEYFRHLDLTGSLGRSLKLRELTALLFPSQQPPTNLQDSWDVPEESTVPRPLLPNLSHLSLGVRPDCSQSVSWRHLLSFVSHCPTLTHLSLAFWPEPSLTPNAKLASFVSPQGRTVQYSGTGPYSHSLDNDWAEAIVVLRRLSKILYGLEYLDLTGCGEWSSALWSHADHDAVDWVGDWGKISTILLYPGYELEEDAGPVEAAKYWEVVARAERVERHIRGKRAGRGRFITVETVKRPV